MNIIETTKTRKNSFSLASLSIGVVAIFTGLLISLIPSHREYFPAGISIKNADDNDRDAGGMEQFFFNARKNIKTNAMDYPSMLAASIADRAMNTMRRGHSAASAAVPNFNWISMGPNNVGGRTRAILIDNTDPTHQTIFAGGVSGGIWKSTNGGGTWDSDTSAIAYSLNDTLKNINVSCIAQDANGVIYIGTGEGFMNFQTGEGFSTGILGGGIYKSTDDGKTWQVLPFTVPAANKATVTWSYVNRIAIRPDNPNVIYAATQGGLLVSHDAGVSWGNAINSKNNKALVGNLFNALDVKISTDGSVVVACVGVPRIGFEPSTITCYGYYCYPQSAPDSVFTEMKSSGAGRLLGNAARIEFAISPTDANRVYATVIGGNDLFGNGGASSGIFMTMNAKTSGGYWYEIGPGGSDAFNPYAMQANYDNTLGVPPANEAQVLAGGATLWEWSGASLSDTVGAWQKISHYNSFYEGDPLWIHADEHAIVFDQNNPETVYIGCDGGIFKSTNLYINPTPSLTVNSITNLYFGPINRNYNVTQYYTLCFSPYVDTSVVTVSINNGTATQKMVEHLGVGGGTQDNGSPYMNGKIFNGHPNDAVDMSGGDGAGAVVSSLDPNIAYFCSDYGTLEREGNLGALGLPPINLPSAYTKTLGDSIGGDIDSASKLGGAGFVFPVALYENSYDLLNKDSLSYVNQTDSTIPAGATVFPTSSNGNIMYPYKLTKSLASGASRTVPDRVVSRLAVGFAGSLGGIWINGQGASSNTVIWMPIGGPLSKPTAFSGSDAVHCLAWSPDGNNLFAGTDGGQLYRFSNINSVIANKYNSGALWYNEANGIHPTNNTNIVSTNLTIAGFSGRDILSISVDPANGNNMMVTLGNYGSVDYVYYSNNALAASPTFTIAQGNLPAMPVYGSILDIIDSNGSYITNSAMLATEKGIYTTTNITKGNATVWVKNNNGMPNVMTLAVQQQTTKPWMCNNPGVIYVATHGRGIWASNTFFNRPTAVQDVTAPKVLNDLLIYPNPMTSQGNIQFSLSSADNITISIYDMQGKEVKTINMGNQSSGSHLVTFESTTLRGGTYFAALTGSNFRKVSKFVVVK